MNNPKFQVFKSNANSEYYYHLQSINGEKILSGEGYKTKQSCLDGIASVKANAPIDSRYDRKMRPIIIPLILKRQMEKLLGEARTIQVPPIVKTELPRLNEMHQGRRLKT